MTTSDDPAAPPFASFELDPALLEAIELLGFETPTPVQVAAMPPLLAGKDVIGRARTGSGKTAAFGLPLLQRVKNGGPVKALVLTPTRELALQVGEALRTFAKKLKGVNIATIYGGAPYGPQLKALKSGATVVVGTPGRVIDHLERGTLNVKGLEYFVLDEADEMLRMGFIDDVEKILTATPAERQVALFSATMPDAIRNVARKHLKQPVVLQVEAKALSVDHIGQHWMRVPQRFKLEALTRVLRGIQHGTTLVFARTRAGCAQSGETLSRRGIEVETLHGDLNQAARERVLSRLRSERVGVVIATDVAARGIDIDHITHVINMDMPDGIESYVHRIGRTGRAGRKGTAISFVEPRETYKLKSLERGLKVRITQLDVPSDADIVRVGHRYLQTMLEEATTGDLSAARDWMNALAESASVDVEQLAAAAVKILAEREDITLEGSPKEGPPTWAVSHDKRERTQRERPQRPDDVFLYFPVGFKRGVKASDLVGMLANEAKVKVALIGRITVLPHKSFVGLPKEIAEQVLKNVPSTTIRGVVVPMRLARDRSDTERSPGAHKPARHPRPSRKHGPAKRKPHLGKVGKGRHKKNTD